MSNNLYLNKNAVSKWLLAVTLLLSVFAIQGPASQSAGKTGALQTALFVNNSTRAAKSISFSGAMRQLHASYPASLFFTGMAFDLASLHSRQINIRLKNHTTPNLLKKQTCFFYHTKIIPQNTGDKPFLFLG